jgi:iron complex outermembrane receptor protein
MSYRKFLKSGASGLCTALVAGFAATTGVAVAQDGASDDRIVVTGSRIGRSEVTSVSPISVFDSAELEVQAVSTLADFADNLTIAPGGETNARTNNGSGGQATISLRGLGPQRTLVLVNGRRMTPSTTQGYTDLNMIPVSAIGRIEVLRDGASTAYGSDAVAGVVNIITKDNVDGTELFVQHDRTGENDGELYRYGMTMGGNLPNGRFTINLEYYDRGTIKQGDREFSACPWAEENGQLVCGGSGTAYPAHIFDSFAAVNTGDDYTLGTDGVARPWGGAADAYNYAARSYLVTPQEVFSGFADAEMDVMDSDRWGQASAFGEFLFAHRTGQQQLAPVGTFWNPVVPAWHPGNPFGSGAAGLSDADLLALTGDITRRGVNIARRFAELDSGRYYTQDAISWRSVVGFQGELPAGILWDASLTYGRFNNSIVNDGQVNPVRAAQVLCNDPASLAAMACSVAPNLIWDPFRTGTLNDTIANYMTVRNSPVQRTSRLSSQFNFSGDLGSLQLPGGPIDWAMGYEHRRDKAEFIADGAASINQIYFVSANSTGGEMTSTEFYAETRLPIISGADFADLLAVELSVRSSNYDVNDFNSNNSSSFDSNTYKAAIEWAPNSDVRFRATYNTGLRAPSIGELFSPQSQTALQYNDPCNGYVADGSNLAANCAADGLAPGWTQAATFQAAAVNGGNPNLIPEESTGITVGVVFTPTMFEGLTVSLDYFDFEITNAIGSADVATISSDCYNSANFSDVLCALITGPSHPIVNSAPMAGPGGARRSAIGPLSGVLTTNANLSTYLTSGVDMSVDWQGPSFEIFSSSADLVLGMDVTYLERFAYQVLPGGAFQEYGGTFATDPFTQGNAAFPELSATTRAGVVGESWSFNWISRYISEVADWAAPSGLSDEAEAVWYHDLQATYDMDDVGLTFGIKNVANETPPYVSNNDDMNTIQQTYDTAGRYFYGRVIFRR